jgi:hypothetical protein
VPGLPERPSDNPGGADTSGLGWDAMLLWLRDENSDPTTTLFPLIGPEHTVELNIPNTDCDTYRDAKTGFDTQPTVWSPPSTVDGDFLDELTPDYELGLLGASRNPRISCASPEASWGYTSLHPNWMPEPTAEELRFAPTPLPLPSTEVGSSAVITLNIRNADPLPVTPADPVWQPKGNLLLDLDDGLPFAYNGPPDFTVEVVALDGGTPYSIADAEQLTLRVTFAPTVVGTRQGVLTIASNDAAHPNLNISLVGTGLQPPALNN